MKILFSFLGIIFACQVSLANILPRDNYNTELKILNELDIDFSYLRDPYFMDLKADSNIENQKHFLKAIKDNYSQVLMLKEVLKNSDVPESIFYLAIIESGLKNKATSKVKAAGIWQFMPQTARLLGLRVDRYIDERRDPVKSTKAAIKYLSMLKKQFGKWYLALVAYNCGDGKLRRAIREAKSDDLSILTDPNKKYLPLETRNFIRKILLTAKNAEDLNFMIEEGSFNFNLLEGSELKRVNGYPRTRLSLVAKASGVSLSELKKLNSHILKGKIPSTSGKVSIYLPKSSIQRFSNNFRTPKNNDYIYKIKAGDTLFDLSRKFDITISELKKANNMKSSKLKIGDHIVIPE